MALAGRLDRAVRPRLPAAGRNHHLTTSPRARAEESEKPADRRDRHARNQPAPIEDQLIRGKINSRSIGGSRLMLGANDGFLCQDTTADHCASELPSVLAQVGSN